MVTSAPDRLIYCLWPGRSIMVTDIHIRYDLVTLPQVCYGHMPLPRHRYLRRIPWGEWPLRTKERMQFLG